MTMAMVKPCAQVIYQVKYAAEYEKACVNMNTICVKLFTAKKLIVSNLVIKHMN